MICSTYLNKGILRVLTARIGRKAAFLVYTPVFLPKKWAPGCLERKLPPGPTGEGARATSARPARPLLPRPPCWVTGFSGKPPYREMRGFACRERQPRSGAWALQTSGLHPRSHWGQYAAFADMRISLLIWSSEYTVICQKFMFQNYSTHLGFELMHAYILPGCV